MKILALNSTEPIAPSVVKLSNSDSERGRLGAESQYKIMLAARIVVKLLLLPFQTLMIEKRS